MKEIITSKHKFWRALGVRLNDSLLEKECKCDPYFNNSKKIIKSLPGNIDIEETIKHFQDDNELYCDCDVCFYILSDNNLKLKNSGY